MNVVRIFVASLLATLFVSASHAQTPTCWSLDPALGYLCGPTPTPTPTPSPTPTHTPTPTPTPSPINGNCGLLLGGTVTFCDTKEQLTISVDRTRRRRRRWRKSVDLGGRRII